MQPFPRLRAAAIDGRLSNVFVRREQLKRLHNSLVTNKDAIWKAIVKDSGNTRAEAAVEYSLALASIKKQVASLNPEKELEDEYRIANGKNALDRREATGIVYIEPTSHTLFFSIVVPLSVAIAAGNCVVIQLDNNLRILPALLQKILSSCLDADVFAVTTKSTDTTFLASCVQVLQSGSNESSLTRNILSSLHAPVFGIVDRSANLEDAADALLTARFSFNGKSPYAPDVVLVNEFAKKEFLTAVVQKSIKFMTGRNEDEILDEKRPGARKQQENTSEDGAIDSKGVKVITSGSNGTILEVIDRKSEIFGQKRSKCLFIVHAVRSLDDAIDLANRNGTLQASYIFASPVAGKYLSQFVQSHVTFVNHIPTELLVGPAAPLGFPISPSSRYSTIQFTESRPIFVEPTSISAHLAELVVSGNAKEIEQVLGVATSDLPVQKRPLKAAPFGFFDQGVFIGLGLAATTLLAGTGSAMYYGIRLWKRTRS